MYTLMIVPSDFPNGDAGAVRDMAFANIFKELGYEVFLIGAGKNEKEGNYNGVYFYSVYMEAHNQFDNLRRFIFSKTKYMSLIKKLFKRFGIPSVIYINDVSHSLIRNLRNLAINYNIPIIHDSTEWYSPCEFVWGKFDKQYILKNHLNLNVIRQPIRVIGISSYLTEYFKEKGLKTARIPVIMDVSNTISSINTDNKIKLIYAGSPGNKDYLKEIIIGITLLPKERQRKLEMHILGVNEEQIKKIFELQKIPKCIKAYGRVSREKVEEVMLGMDFSVLLRPSEERYAKAGFPTKAVEAMNHGVAMICNISSDLGMYLKDEDNSIIVKDCTAEEFSRTITKVLSLSRNKIDTIKKNARKTAVENFDYRLWKDTVKNLLN
ncbi:MAG: glycosyltransferase [Lachnospiraceae bacterium]|nr:glycosyltransferase [Lachnospiraceae bacterium]